MRKSKKVEKWAAVHKYYSRYSLHHNILWGAPFLYLGKIFQTCAGRVARAGNPSGPPRVSQSLAVVDASNSRLGANNTPRQKVTLTFR